MKQWVCMLLLAMPLMPARADGTDFGKLDRDRDGQLSPREVAALPLNFPELDADHNGYLSRSELGYMIVDDEEPASLRDHRQ